MSGTVATDQQPSPKGPLTARPAERRNPAFKRRKRGKGHEPKPAGWLAYLTLILLTVACYAPIFQSGLIWSEYDEVERSPFQSMEHWTEAWSADMIRNGDPLTLTSYFVEETVPLPTAVVHHGINLLLHLIAVIVFLKTLEALKLPSAYSASLIFALHPSVLQTIFWSGYRSELIGLIFILAALIFGIRNRGPRDFVGLLLFSLLAYLLHPASLVIPLILGLCIFYQKPNSRQRDYNRLLPLVFFALFLGVWIFGGRNSLELYEGNRFGLYAQNLFFHIKQALLPIDSQLFHSFGQRSNHSVGAQNSVLPFLLFFPFFVLVAFNYKKLWARGLLLGLTSFLLLSIYGSAKAGQFVDGSLAFEDHQQYLALPILIALVVCSLGGIARKMGTGGRILWSIGLTAFALFQWALTASYAYSVSDRQQMWYDLAKQWPNAWQPKLALIHTIQGSEDGSELLTQEQIIEYLLAILEKQPNRVEERILLAQIYRRERQNTNALVQYRRILRDTEPTEEFLRETAEFYDELGLNWDARNVRDRIANRTD